MVFREKDIELAVDAGIEPSTDSTPLATPKYTAGDKVRFDAKGRLRKLGGWVKFSFDVTSVLSAVTGIARLLYSFILDSNNWYVVGTHLKLYATNRGVLYDITPTAGTPVAIANSLDTFFYSLGADPIATTNGSKFVTFTYGGGTRIMAGDSVTVAGAIGFAGIPAGNFNATHSVVSAGTNTFVILVTTTATSTTTGGGAGVTVATAIIKVTHPTNGLSDGNKVLIASAVDTGGILAADINGVRTIRNVQTNSYDIIAGTKATSSVTAGGGAATTVQMPLTAGFAETSNGYGYSMGLYNVGPYGVAKIAYLPGTANEIRLWSADRFGDAVVLTPGGQQPLYVWIVDGANIPTQITAGTAPALVNYVFSVENFVIVLGPDGEEDKIRWCDQGNYSIWAPDADNQARSVSRRGAGRLITHIALKGITIVFSKTRCDYMRYMPNTSYVFKTDILSNTAGIISQNARASDGRLAYWMTNNLSLYKSDGNTAVEVGNDKNIDSYNTVKRYLAANMTTTQKDKTFAGYVEAYSEVWYFYQSQNGTEVDSYIIHNTAIDRFYIGTLNRTAMEYPAKIDAYQYLIDEDGDLYLHENGDDDDTAAMVGYIETNYIMAGAGQDFIEITGVRPDAVQSGEIELTIYTKDYANGAETSDGPYPITTTTDYIDFQAYGRMRKYRLSFDTLGTSFQIGKYVETIKGGGNR